MLRPVVLEGAVNVFEPGAEVEVTEEDHQLHHALQQVPQPHGGIREEVEQAGGEQGGQDDEQRNGEGDPRRHGNADDPLHKPFAAEALFQPLLELGGGLLLLVVRIELRRPHEGLHPLHQGGQEVDHPADERDAQDGVPVLDELEFLFLDLQLPLLVAHHDGLLLRPPHEDALNECLAANGGAEGAVLRRFTVFLGFHSHSYLFAWVILR